MTLRLVLVSLVAGLGLGLPAWPKIEGWVDSTQKWMNTRLAEIDVRRGEEKQYVVIRDLLAAEMERARAARLSRRVGPVEPPVSPLMATIALPHPTSPRHRSDLLAGRTAAAAAPLALPFALPKLDDFLTASPLPEATTRPEPAVVAARPEELARLAWDRFGGLGKRLADDFARGLRDAEARQSLDLAFAALEASENLYFDGDFALKADVAPVAEPELVATSDAEPAPLLGFEALEQSADLYFAGPLGDEAAPSAEAVAEVPATVAEEAPAPAVVDAGLPMLPDDVFAPSEPAVAALDAPEPSVAPEVNRAVRLTREAFSAWMDVLTNPALVTASHTASLTR